MRKLLQGQGSQSSIYNCNLTPDDADLQYNPIYLNGNNPAGTLDDASPVLLTPVWLEFNCVGQSRRAWLGGGRSQSKDFGGRPALPRRIICSSCDACVIQDMHLHCTESATCCSISSLSHFALWVQPFWLNAVRRIICSSCDVSLGGWVIRDLYLHCTLTVLLLTYIFSLILLCGSSHQM